MNQHNLAAIAATHDTPFYLYDMDAASAHYQRLARQLPADIELYYCVKANSNPRVLRAYLGKVSGLDVSSGGEIEIALRAGFDARSMSFAGPGKRDQELELAVSAGVGIVSVESPHELARLSAIARQNGCRQTVTLRINPRFTGKEFPMRMGGGPSQFGIPEEDVDPVVAAAKADSQIDLAGFHIYSGTNCLEPKGILENVAQTLDIVGNLGRKHDVKLRKVNLGGGFGIPYFAGQLAMDADALVSDIVKLISHRKAQEPTLSDATFILELGRFLIGPFGVYVARVVDTKETRGKRYAIMDGGMNHCFPATGNFGQLIKKNYPIENVSKESGSMLVSQELVGPLCTPIDSMARALEVPRCDIGDLIAFRSCGAYAFSASPLLFLGHDTPLELVYYDRTYAVGRPRKKANAFE